MLYIHQALRTCAKRCRPIETPLHIVYCVMAAGVFHEYYAITSGVLAVVITVTWLERE
jgi:hypothetical protein